MLAGSFIRLIEARHGDTINTDFGPYGSVNLYFA
ncbi:2-keto-4-pentenoate hydratase [Rhizobium leguminosarum]|nr:2-keto-4-pentenoate hydratase [Rhizobium leguminosarum]